MNGICVLQHPLSEMEFVTSSITKIRIYNFDDGKCEEHLLGTKLSHHNQKLNYFGGIILHDVMVETIRC